jgi:hypothetical protein
LPPPPPPPLLLLLLLLRAASPLLPVEASDSTCIEPFRIVSSWRLILCLQRLQYPIIARAAAE